MFREVIRVAHFTTTMFGIQSLNASHQMTTVQPTTHVPTSNELESYQLVNSQYGECSSQPKFFDSFYAEFTGKSPEIATAFANTDMQAQKDALRNGLAFLIMYAKGSATAGNKLDRLGGTHARTGYNIRPQLYPIWINALVSTVKKHIPGFDAASEAAWRKVLQLGVNRITSWY